MRAKKQLATGLVAASALIAAAGVSMAQEVKAVGISVGSLGNPGFVIIANTATRLIQKANPDAQVTTVGYDYDIGKQVNQIDNFIAAGVDFILLNPGDSKAITPAIKKAQAAGIPVIAFDTFAEGADAAITTDNVMAGRIACQYIVDKLDGKGDVIIQSGPQVSAVVDRVDGCKEVFAQHPDINILSDDQDGKGSRDGGMSVAQGYLTRFPHIDAIFTINDPQAIGTALAAKQAGRDEFFITSVDGSPDIEDALKDPAFEMIEASSSQDFYAIPKVSVETAFEILNGNKPAEPLILIPSTLVTRDNVADYKGWNYPHEQDE